MRTKPHGAEIRRLREARGLTCTQLAKASGLSPAHMSRIENEQRLGSARIRYGIAAALGVPVDVIFPVDRFHEPAA